MNANDDKICYYYFYIVLNFWRVLLNNNILIRLRFTLDIKDNNMIEIFKLGGILLEETTRRKDAI